MFEQALRSSLKVRLWKATGDGDFSVVAPKGSLTGTTLLSLQRQGKRVALSAFLIGKRGISTVVFAGSADFMLSSATYCFILYTILILCFNDLCFNLSAALKWYQTKKKKRVIQSCKEAHNYLLLNNCNETKQAFTPRQSSGEDPLRKAEGCPAPPYFWMAMSVGMSLCPSPLGINSDVDSAAEYKITVALLSVIV